MARTNTFLQLVALLAATSLACGPTPGAPDGGPDDGGPPVDPDAPVFVEGPRIVSTGPGTLSFEFRTDVPVTATVQWRAGEEIGQHVVAERKDAHRVDLADLPAGRTIEVAVAARADNGKVTVARVSGRTTLRTGGPWRVLFDAAHGQEAGNADWVVDSAGRYPSPADPSTEDDWCGAYSAFGVALVKSGLFEVEILSSGDLLYGTSDSQDLSRYDVLVIPEPNSAYGTNEAAALESFIRAGGGALLIGNHRGSDRDNDGWDAIRAYEVLMEGRGYGAYFVGDGGSGKAAMTDTDPLADGPFGPVERLGCYVGTTVSIRASENPTARTVAFLAGKGHLVAAGQLGQGRFVLHGDSSGADDGTACSSDSHIYDAWHDPEEQNAAFFLNSVAWLAGAY